MKSSLILAGPLALVLPALAQEKITYVDHVRPLLENKCFSCHNPDKKKGDLDLTSFAATMTGGGSGAIITSGDPDGSKMIGSITRREEPYMPPEGAPLSAKEIEVVANWIQGGVLETKSSLAKKGAPRPNIALAAAPKGKPEGPPPMPENVLLEPVVVAPRTTAVTALAASPWAPLVAIAGMKQVLIHDANTRSLAGVYPYPEGFIRSLKFSQNGALLVAGGGRGGKAGNAVVWDVKTGRRVAEAGHEFDQVMCADISPNHAMIVIGGPSKKVKCYHAGSGEEAWVIKKHTEWILNVAFSPDGVLVASADRNGGIIISEAATGGEFYVLEGHKVACTGLSWRSDSNLIASCAEDGKVAIWEMQNGKLVKSWDAHGGGALSVVFAPDGKLVSSGRDGLIRVWDVNGKKLAESKAQGDLVTKVAALSDGKNIVSGDWQGNVRIWSADKFEELGTLSSNPSPIAQRIADTERQANELVAAVAKAEAEAKSASEAAKAKEGRAAELKLDALRARLAWAQKHSSFLKAAQFNVSVLAEKEKLEKLESEVKDLQEGLKETEAGMVAAAERIEAAKKSIADATTRLPALDAALIRLRGELPAVEKILDPTKAEEAKLVLQTEAQKKIIAGNEAAQMNLEQEKANRIVAAQKAAEEINKQTAVLQKQADEVGAKAAGPLKLAEEKRSALAKAESELNDAKQKQAGAAKLVQQRDAEAKAKQGAQSADANAIAAAVKALAEAQAASKKSDTVVQTAQSAANGAKTAAETAEKAASPLRAQQQTIAAQIQKQKKSLGEKQAEPGVAERDFAAKSQPLQAASAAAKATLVSLEKRLADVRAKLAADAKIVEAKRAEVAKAEADVAGAKKAQMDGQRTIENSTKEIADKTKAISEGKAELAKLEPQLGPQRDRVKKLSDQYLAMLLK